MLRLVTTWDQAVVVAGSGWFNLVGSVFLGSLIYGFQFVGDFSVIASGDWWNLGSLIWVFLVYLYGFVLNVEVGLVFVVVDFG